MFGTIIVGIIAYAILAAILAVLLQVASKLVLKEAIDFGDAYKASFVACILSGLADAGVEQLMGPEAGATLTLISIGTTYVIWVLALSIIIDLTLGESVIIAAVFTVIKIVIGLLFVAIAAGAVAAS